MAVILNLNGFEVRCKLARTQTELTIGLQRHASLAPDEGMLFLLGRTRTATFHMGHVRFPIDLVGLDAESRVTKVVEGAMPGSMERWTFPQIAAVLEIPAGTARSARLRTGDVVTCQDASLNGNLRTAQSMPPGFDAFDADDLFGEGATQADPNARPADEVLLEGDRFKVGRFGPTWIVVRSMGATGYVQRDGHKRKWFGFSHNRDTSEIAVYPVKQGSGDRIGDPVAFGPLNKLDDAKLDDAEFDNAELDETKTADLLELEDAQPDEPLEDHSPHVSTSPGGKTFDTPKEQYFKHLWGPDAAEEALDVDTSLQTRVGYQFTAMHRMAQNYTAGQLLRCVDPIALNTETGASQSFGSDTVFVYRGLDEQGIMHLLQPRGESHRVMVLPRVLKENFVSAKTTPRPDAVNRVPIVKRKAQIVDEQKFVEKAATILFSHADRIPWQVDVLNGGATERAVITRTDLIAWLSGNQETGQEAAEPEAIQHLAEAASNDRGLRLLGTAFVLAELADFTRLGFSGRQPTLVLYREAAQDTA